MKNQLRPIWVTLLMVFAMICAVGSADVRGQQTEVRSQKSEVSQELPAATVKEQLPDGGYLVVIGNTEFRAITRDLADSIVRTNRELDKAYEDLDKAKRVRAELENQIALHETNLAETQKLVKIANDQTASAISIAGNYETLYLGEKDLRLKAEKLYAAPGKVTGFFQHPVVQLAEKIGKPILENWLVPRRQPTIVMTYDQVALLQSQQRAVPFIVLRQ